MLTEIRRVLKSKYLESVITLTRFNMNKQYRYSFLGWAWTLLMPTVQIAVYTFIFGTLLKVPHKAQALYILTGLLPWTFMANTLMSSTGALLSRGDALKRCIIPKTTFAIADVLRNFHVFIIAFGSLYLVSLIFFVDFSFTILLFPISLIPLVIFTSAVSILMSFMAPYFRDISEFINVGLMVGFYATPILYQIGDMPEKYHIIFNLNPVYILFRPIFEVVYAQKIPDLFNYGLAMAVALISSVLCYWGYKRLRNNVVYYL